MLLYLPRTPDWSNKVLNSSKAGERLGGTGRQNKQKEKKRKRKIKEQKKKQEKEENSRGQSPSHSASHGVRVKVRYTEVRKGKSPEAKGSQDNVKLRKAGKKQAKPRLGVPKNKPPCVIYLGTGWRAPQKAKRVNHQTTGLCTR